MSLATVLERLDPSRAPQRKSFGDVAAELFELNARWREGQAALDKAQGEVDRLDELLGDINNQASALANDPGLSDEEWQALVDAGLHPDEWETGSAPRTPVAPGKSRARSERKTEDGMLASALKRLMGGVATAPEAKADTDALIAELAAKDKEGVLKADELEAILEPHGVDTAEKLQDLVDKLQDQQSKAEGLEADIEILQEEMQEIGAQLDEAGLSYPYGLDLQML